MKKRKEARRFKYEEAKENLPWRKGQEGRKDKPKADRKKAKTLLGVESMIIQARTKAKEQ